MSNILPKYRQGDVLLIPVGPEIAHGLKPHTEAIVARGEATGHSHVIIDGDVLVDAEGKLFVRAKHGTELRHATEADTKADHDWFKIPPDLYEVRIEEDYTPEGLRHVVD